MRSGKENRSFRSRTTLQTPWALRRRPKGSLEPLTWSPTPMAPTIESILSASDRIAPAERGRRSVLEAARLVVLVDRPMDGGGKALLPGVEAAHPALEAGEFLDHLRQQVGLAQRGRLDGVGLDLGRGELVAEIADDLFQALRLVFVAAELLLEEHVLQTGRPVGQRDLAVLVPEEAGVREPGPEDALVAPADEPLGVLDGVGDPEEIRQLLPVADDGEELLAFAHGRGQDLERQARDSPPGRPRRRRADARR